MAVVWLAGLALASCLAFALYRTIGLDPLAATLLLVLLIVVVTLGVLLRERRLSQRDGRAIELLTSASRELAAGHFERTVSIDGVVAQELRDLADGINAIAGRVRHDIADMKRLERVRSEFLANVSHELRTPIFSVQGYLETLIDGAVDDPTVRDDFLRKAHHNVLRLHHLLTDLIEISRIESGDMKMSFRYFDAVKFFREIVEEMRPTAEMSDVRLELRVHSNDSVHSAYGDRDRLKQVVVNLVENAIKYNRAAGEVMVELAFSDTRLVVRVNDTGIGIPSEDLGRIFERFYRVDKDRSRAVGGSGLGLAIVKHIIEAHRSSIGVESEVGRGSTFSFELKR